MKTERHFTKLGSAVAGLVLAANAIAAPPLSVGGAKPVHVRISLTQVPATESIVAELPMIARINRTIDLTAPEIETLRKACKSYKGIDGSWDAATTLVYITSEAAGSGSKAGARATYEVRRTDHATLLVRPVDPAPATTIWTLDPLTAPMQMIAMAGLAAKPAEPHEKLAPGREIQVNASAGAIHIDSSLVEKRLYHGTSISVQESKRDLPTGRVLMRLPATYKPEMYCGLLLWVHAGDEAVLPDSLYGAADKLGLVLATQVDAGNGTPIVTRMQRVSDTLATVGERVHFDPERIYIGGISGGAKTSLMLAAAFPEVFAGSLCIVGFGTYVQTENHAGIGVWPPLFSRFGGDQWKRFTAVRLAAVTGDKDFNHGPILAAAEVMARDNLTCKVFDIPGLGHQMPDADHAVEELMWLDEPGRTANERASNKAAEILNGQDHSEAALRQVIEIAPFSASAWEAYRKLGKK